MGNTKQNKAVSTRVPWEKVFRPYTINSRSASRHHTDSLGASTAREKDSAGPAHRRRDCVTLYETACSVRAIRGARKSGFECQLFRKLC